MYLREPGLEDVLLEPLEHDDDVIQKRLRYWAEQVYRLRKKEPRLRTWGVYAARQRLPGYNVSNGNKRYAVGIYFGPIPKVRKAS
jgi:hypothetical protein